MKTHPLLAALFATATLAQADVMHYDVSVTFLDDTKFTGTFDYDAATQQISNLRGQLDDVLMGNVETLNYQLSAAGDGKGGITAYVYAMNTTEIGTNPPLNNNVNVGINFNAIDPALGATDLAQLAYMDCSPGGLMGKTCMYDLSWHIPVFPMDGGHGILSETITASGQSSRSDCLMNWAESNYPQLFSPAVGASQSQRPYYFRHYTGSNAYLGISATDSHVYYLGADGQMLDAGHLSNWLSLSGC